MKLRPVKQSLMLREFLALDARAEEGGLSVTELERWGELKRLIEARLGIAPAPPACERRRSVRVPLSLNVRFQTQSELASSLLRNLSQGGFFIETKEPLPIGSIFRARIVVEEWGLRVEPTVKVVSHCVGPELAIDAQGMGVAFHQLTQNERNTIRAIYDLCLGVALETLASESR